MSPLANPYVRIAIGAAISEYITPKIKNSITVPELTEQDAIRNTVAGMGVTGAVVAFTYVALGMIAGGKATVAAAAATGGA